MNRRSGVERRAAAEAFVWLVAASLVVRFAPFRTIATIARRRVDARPPADPGRQVALVGWAVAAAARRARFRAVCIERGLAAQAMLRRRGIATTLHYGVARAGGNLTAHVWVRWGEHDVAGGAEAAGFRELAVFTPDGTG
ncbi:lasso peptide biosynthesis B2 protein [Sphingomonas sp.]|uniref:lasso peptide biosynthesis B2 protein n=1 Tax=Sphingomonas sp. TaxID=28214 RepID=UPI002DD6B75F|nr:lasso peptide biosynthesis B2 protein [Sphingomonas sp.]